MYPAILNYVVKICDYISYHYDIGELYMEFIKDACIVKKGRKRVSCGNGWLGSVMDTRIPWPFPVIETSRYKSVFESPACLDGKP